MAQSSRKLAGIKLRQGSCAGHMCRLYDRSKYTASRDVASRISDVQAGRRLNTHQLLPQKTAQPPPQAPQPTNFLTLKGTFSVHSCRKWLQHTCGSVEGVCGLFCFFQKTERRYKKKGKIFKTCSPSVVDRTKGPKGVAEGIKMGRYW